MTELNETNGIGSWSTVKAIKVTLETKIQIKLVLDKRNFIAFAQGKIDFVAIKEAVFIYFLSVFYCYFIFKRHVLKYSG